MRALCRTTWLLPLLALPALACTNPVHSEAIDALGPEVGEDEGDEHRPGQPCLVCHGGDGPGPDLAVAGTIYATRPTAASPSPPPAAGVRITLTDAKGATQAVRSNRVGNFYVRRWQPTFPLTVQVEGGSTQMKTRIGRDGGCAACHRGVGSSHSMPAVYLKESP